MKEVLHNIHLLSLGGVNAFLIDHGKMTLIDTGYAGNGQKIFGYLEKIGKRPGDLENIIITHLHILASIHLPNYLRPSPFFPQSFTQFSPYTFYYLPSTTFVLPKKIPTLAQTQN